MVDDVVRDRVKVGMPLTDVRDLLGPPEEVTVAGTWVYFVDFEDTGFLGTCVSLSVYPGKDHRVASTEIVRSD